MNMSLEEYHKGMLYAVVYFSKETTDGKTAIEIIDNHPYEKDSEKGQYTHKVYHIANRLPRIIQAIAPESAMMAEEKAWNAFPHCKTRVTNPLLGHRMEIAIESVHLDGDRGECENVFGLDAEVLKKRQVTLLDVGNDELVDVHTKNFEKFEPANFTSKSTGRGPLKDNWMKEATPIMCAYKLVTIKFSVFGIQGKMENFIDGAQRNVFIKLHKQIFTLLDQWHHLSLEKIRDLESEAKRELDQKLDGMDLETRTVKSSRTQQASEDNDDARECDDVESLDYQFTESLQISQDENNRISVTDSIRFHHSSHSSHNKTHKKQRGEQSENRNSSCQKIVHKNEPSPKQFEQ